MIRRFRPWVYVAWIALCAILFVALSGLEDPSRPRGRMLSIDAGARALEIVRSRDRRLGQHEVVHVAFARRGEGGTEDRWIVLLDRVPHTSLREAIVVELAAADGTLLATRTPR